MKRLTITLAALALAAAQGALAQPPGPPPGGSPVERLTQELGLSDAQKEKVTKIFEEQRSKRDAQRSADQASGQTLTPDARRARAEAGQQELLQKLGGVLTPAQLQKFKQIQQERRQNAPPPTSG
jgi:Spy/CpxP family protein refolding chaperone